MWSFSDLFLAFLCGGLGGSIVHLIANWTLRQKATQLEFQVATLEERLMIEQKKRASAAAKSARDIQLDILEAAKIAQPAGPPRQWWEQPWLPKS